MEMFPPPEDPGSIENSARAMAIRHEESPLIVTLRMGSEAAARFTALRLAHFPPERNWLDAHVTLFHALPGMAIDEVLKDARDAARGRKTFSMQCDRVVFLGAGVAFGLVSPEAVALRDALAARWAPMLTRQDQARRKMFHVTVQNKVSPAAARDLRDTLQAGFVAEAVPAVGLDIWHYEGGPWRAAASFAFDNDVGDAPSASR